MNIPTDDLIVNPDKLTKVVEQELGDAAKLEGVTPDIEVLYAPTTTISDDPAAPKSDSPRHEGEGLGVRVDAGEVAKDWPTFQRQSMRPQHELTDLFHIIDRPDQRRQALAAWQAHLNDGWETVDISTSHSDGHWTRIVVLRRECPPIPTAPTPHTAAAAAAYASHPISMGIPVGDQMGEVKITMYPPINVPASPVLNKILVDHPIAAHIHEHGVEGTLDAMNSRVREVGRTAYEKRLASRQSRPQTLIPSTL